MEGSPCRDLSIELSHIREKGRNPFASTGVGKWTHRNLRSEVLLTDDPLSSFPQSPAGTGSGLGSEIGNRDDKLNCTTG